MAESEILQPEVPVHGGDEGLSGECIDAIRESLEQEDNARILSLTAELHASDIAELLSLVTPPEREALVQLLAADFEAETLTYLNDDIREDVFEMLGTGRVAALLGELETDDAVQVIEDMAEAEQQELLAAMPEADRAELEEGLAYPEDSAGRLMQREFVAVPEYWTVGGVIDHLRGNVALPTDFYEIIVIDPRYRPVGSVKLSRIMQSARDTAMRELMEEDVHPIATDTDQEEVAHRFGRYGLAEAPVVNRDGRLVGVITVDDIVHVIAEEQEEDFMRAGGIIDSDLHADLVDTVKRRFPWLLVNLCTAAMAAWVISHFEDTIARWVTLAVMMPMIASMSGNAGIQSVTVSVRSIATRELQRHNAWPVIRKEMFTNLINGVGLSLIMSAAIWLIYGDWELAGIFSAAMVGTLTIAGLAGSLIPLLLAHFKVDPAIASGVFLTTLTDIISFFSFLGLAALLIL